MKNFTLFLLFMFPMVLTAATITWDGETDNNWNIATNWVGDVLPGVGDDVDLNGGTVVLTANTQIQRVLAQGSCDLTINVGITLTITGFAGNDDGLEISSSSGLVTNNGTIAISNIATTEEGSDGIHIKGSLINNGTITIDGTGQHGVYLQGGTFTNNATGSLSITNIGITSESGSTPAPDGDGILLDDNSNSTPGDGSTFTNNGTVSITMTDGDDGIYVNDESTFNNALMITIAGTGCDNGIRVDDEGVLNNNSGGTLTINATPDDQLFLDNDGAINNTGTINLNNSNSVGLYVTDDGIFTNMATANVNISGASNFAVQIDRNQSSGFTLAEIKNSGTITIAGGSNDGIRLQEEGVFTNNATGILNLNAVGNGNNDASIQIDESSTGSNFSTFNNSGAVNITSAADHGLELFGTFNNLMGSTFQATNSGDDGIRLRNSGIFNNDGAINIHGSTSDDIETDAVDGTTFSNTGNATFTIGASPGVMNIKDDFDFGSSTITFEINGTTPVTDFDQILNFNDANTITVSSATMHLDWGAFTPAINDEFKVIDETGAVSGPFATVTSSNPAITFNVDYASNADEVKIVVTAIVPVELVRFTGEKTERGVELKWATASEKNNEGFEIERSNNGFEWTKIGYVHGNGNSYELIEYTYLDNQPLSGVNYYRLKQNDFDGASEYSKVIIIEPILEENDVVRIYPNPIFNHLNIEGFSGNITIYNILGQPVKSIQLNNKEQELISLSELANGHYLIELNHDNGSKIVRRVIKASK